MTDTDMRKMRRGYFAATSFTDAQMGKVLDSLAAAGEPTASNTVTLLWSDHVRPQAPPAAPRLTDCHRLKTHGWPCRAGIWETRIVGGECSNGRLGL
eukprot:COSAG04_NODE_4405_length_2116_cov_287.982152_3_plen_97_part_00